MFEPEPPEEDRIPEPPEWAGGPASLECLGRLVALDVNELDPLTQVRYLRRLDAHVAWLESLRNEAMVVVAGAEPGSEDEGREEVAAVLRLAPATAHRRIEVARALANRLPLTREALRRGAVSAMHATVLAEGTAELTDEQAAQVEAAVFPRAETQTLGELRAAVRRWVLRVTPTSAAAAHEQAAAARRVQFWPGEAGMTMVMAELPAADAQTVRLALDALAHCDGRELPVDARRADALVALCAQALSRPDLPRRHGRHVQVQVAIDLPTLLGLAEHPAELAGYGPIPAPVARRLAADATWRRFVTDPVTGHLLDYGHTVYTPPQDLADYITARDSTCCFPGCSRAAYACDLDHTVPFAEGGRTSAHWIRALCRRHHRLKTHKGWEVRTALDGTLIWISPAGARYEVPPRPVLS